MIRPCAQCGLGFEDFGQGVPSCSGCMTRMQGYVQAPMAQAQPVNVLVQNQIYVPYPIYYAPPAYPPPQPYYPPSPTLFARRKDSSLATLLSFFLPGAGQFYNGQVVKALGFLALTFAVDLPLMRYGVGFFTFLVTWLWAMIDAYGTAERINRGQIV